MRKDFIIIFTGLKQEAITFALTKNHKRLWIHRFHSALKKLLMVFWLINCKIHLVMLTVQPKKKLTKHSTP